MCSAWPVTALYELFMPGAISFSPGFILFGHRLKKFSLALKLVPEGLNLLSCPEKVLIGVRHVLSFAEKGIFDKKDILYEL